MVESVAAIVARLKTMQKSWWKHLQTDGWHLCSVCKKVPIAKDQTVCAFCDHKKRRG